GLVERGPLLPSRRSRDATPEAAVDYFDAAWRWSDDVSKGSAAESDVTDAGGRSDTWEAVSEGGSTEPGDVRQLRMRRPEALGTGRDTAKSSVLEGTSDCITILEGNRRHLRIQIADAGTAAASG